MILDQVQAIYFDLRSDQEQIIFVIFLPIEKIKIGKIGVAVIVYILKKAAIYDLKYDLIDETFEGLYLTNSNFYE